MNEFIHYATATALVALPALGVGIGQGLVNKAALKAINEQPSAEGALRRMAIISLTLSETAAVLGVVMAILVIMNRSPYAAYSAYAYGGIGAALAIPGFLVGLISSLPGRAAISAAARQPLFADKILQLLLITQTILQTPTIFGFIISLVIFRQIDSAHTLADGVRLLASGISFALGSFGPLLGLGIFTRAACHVAGLNRQIYPQLRTFTFISQALIEAPIVFALLVSLTLTGISSSGNGINDSVVYSAAALIIGLTTCGTGISSGRAARAACLTIGDHPALYTTLSKMSILSQTFIDTTSIYGLVLSLTLLFIR